MKESKVIQHLEYKHISSGAGESQRWGLGANPMGPCDPPGRRCAVWCGGFAVRGGLGAWGVWLLHIHDAMRALTSAVIRPAVPIRSAAK